MGSSWENLTIQMGLEKVKNKEDIKKINYILSDIKKLGNYSVWSPVFSFEKRLPQ